MSEYERRLLARAEELAEVDEFAEQVTAVLGGARAARLDPDALGGLTGAALALGASSLHVYGVKSGPSLADERQFAEALTEAEDEICERQRAARQLLDETEDALDAAYLALAAALAMPARTSDEAAAKAAAIAAANERIALCQHAVAILAELLRRLGHALARLRSVPEDLGETYESVYQLLRSGGQMPHDGDWFSGNTVYQAS
jgi:formiminotetrahydrofolate cyclodeaminase